MAEAKKEVSLIQIAGIGITLFSLWFGSWLSMNQRVKALEVGTQIRLENMEKQVDQNKNYYLNILDKINEVNIKLENKQNRN